MTLSPRNRKTIAIIGAGMAGLSCAEMLVRRGHAVTLWDKGRGAGGRMSTRRIDTRLGPATFDHGAQFMLATDRAFRDQLAVWKRMGLVARWSDAPQSPWVGIPGMNAVVRHMAEQMDVTFGMLVKGILRAQSGWHLCCEHLRPGPFDAVVVAVPPEQAAPILGVHDLVAARAALQAKSSPCWTGMFAFDSSLPAPPCIRDTGIIAWAARNSGKPGRAGPEAWVVQAKADWSLTQIETDPDAIADALLEALAEALKVRLPQSVSATAHRWRYAMSRGTALGAIWNENLKLGACGDWLLGSTVEAAWLSGRRLAKLIDSSQRQQPLVAASSNLAG